MPKKGQESSQDPMSATGQPAIGQRLGFGGRSLRRALFISLGGFLVAFLLHIGLGMYAPLEGPLHVVSEAFLHLAIGFLVALIVVLAIEFDAKRTTQQEIREFVDLVSKDVFQAVLERIVPAPVFTEIKNVLLSEVIRSECEYRITLLKGQAPPGYFIIRRELIFTVTNFLNRNVIFPVRSANISDEARTSAARTGQHFHMQLTIDEKDIELAEDKNLFLKGGHIILEHAHTLTPGASARIFLKGEEQTRIEAGQNSYHQGTPVIGMTVEIKNEYPEVIGVTDVHMNHPAASQMKRTEFGRFFLDRAFLPGQGFYVQWKKVETEQASAPVPTGG